MPDQQTNQAERHKALIAEARGIAGLLEAAQDPSVITLNQVGSLLSRIMNELDGLSAGTYQAGQAGQAGTQNDVFASWLQDLADYIVRQELSAKEASRRLRNLADEMKAPEGRPGQYVESLKLGQIFTGAGQEESKPEPPLLDFLKQLKE
jgi:hypothetical protein